MSAGFGKALIYAALGMAAVGFPLWGALEPAQVLILVNRDVGISSRVATMYQKLRGIPNENVLALHLGTERFITPEQYWTQAGGPIQKYLLEHTAIHCVLTTSGVPYVVQRNSDEAFAFDNALAAVLLEEESPKKLRQTNPMFLNGRNLYAAADPRLLKMVYVARLDGPDLATITRMVEDAAAVEQSGLAGPVFGDAQGLDLVTGMGIGDFSIRAAMDRLSGAGFPATLDMQQASWKAPQGGVGQQAAGAAFYIGWYDYKNFQDIFGEKGLARGSIAWHIASGEAQDIWKLPSGDWCVNLMHRGAAVTLGPVREPYVTAFPHGDIFTEGLLSGLTVAESYWLSLPEVNWEMVILGDPLYRPFAKKARPSLVARAYIAENSNHVLEAGQTTSLLVRIECVGPPGSGTPPLVAKTEPEMGLAAASGPVTIPPLKSGSSAVVRIPKVTAGNDGTGMFRLHLAVQDEAEPARRIVVEGRIGFSRLSGGLGPKTQMFVSPSGDALIAGLAGRSEAVEINTLISKYIQTPPGSGVVGAEFSPGGGHVAINLYDAGQKKGAIAVADSGFTKTQALPAGTQFVRWLDGDNALLKTADGLISHSFTGAADRTFSIPEGRTGSVLRGNILLTTGPDGKIELQNGAGPLREILRGVKVGGSIAIADDLSLFGAVDTQKQLWVQHGMEGAPEVIATGVEHALWGPISRRVLVQSADGKGRIYDGRDGKWIELGTIAVAAWSADEERLLFVHANGSSGATLSLMTGRTISDVCDMQRIGAVAALAFSDKGDRGFMLASLDGQLNVWMVGLK